MKPKSIAGKKFILIGLLAFTLLFPSWAVAAPDFNKIVVFGTSLSDSGNFFAETHIVNTAPGYDVNSFLVPNSAYAIGGHHLSNGPTWIEQLAKPLGMKASVLPASRAKNPNAMNYATAGTRAFISPDLPEIADSKTFEQQVDQFLIDVGFDEDDNPTPAPPRCPVRDRNRQ